MSEQITKALEDIIMMLDTPDAYAQDYIAAVCRRLLATLAVAPPPSTPQVLDDLQEWCAIEREKLGAVDGYDYRSGEEYGLRRAEIEIGRRIAALDQKPGEQADQVRGAIIEECAKVADIVAEKAATPNGKSRGKLIAKRIRALDQKPGEQAVYAVGGDGTFNENDKADALPPDWKPPPQILTEVRLATKGYIIALDQHGNQMPDYSGPYNEALNKIERDYPKVEIRRRS